MPLKKSNDSRSIEFVYTDSRNNKIDISYRQNFDGEEHLKFGDVTFDFQMLREIIAEIDSMRLSTREQDKLKSREFRAPTRIAPNITDHRSSPTGVADTIQRNVDVAMAQPTGDVPGVQSFKNQTLEPITIDETDITGESEADLDAGLAETMHGSVPETPEKFKKEIEEENIGEEISDRMKGKKPVNKKAQIRRA